MLVATEGVEATVSHGMAPVCNLYRPEERKGLYYRGGKSSTARGGESSTARGGVEVPGKSLYHRGES